MWPWYKTSHGQWTRSLGHTRDSNSLEQLFPKEHTEKPEFLSTLKSKSLGALKRHQGPLELN